MWGIFVVVFLFFHSNDNLEPKKRYTGAYAVMVATQGIFTWICIAMFQDQFGQFDNLRSNCIVSGELWDWCQVSLSLGTIAWLSQMVLMMRYGTKQDYLSYEEILFDRDHPGASKQREDGLKNRFSSVPLLEGLAIMDSDQEKIHKRRLESLQILADKKREFAYPCRRRVGSGFLFRAVIVMMIIDAVWSVYGLTLAAETMGSQCADTVPRLVTLVSVISVIFTVVASIMLIASFIVLVDRHCYCGIGKPGRVPVKARVGGAHAINIQAHMKLLRARKKALSSARFRPGGGIASLAAAAQAQRGAGDEEKGEDEAPLIAEA